MTEAAVSGQTVPGQTVPDSVEIDFYFDFSSPYGYLAAQRIDALGARHGRAVRWRPYLIGAVFKKIGTRPLVDMEMKGPYARRDLARSARRLGVPLRMPDDFPFISVAACRLYYWLAERDPELAKRVAQELYKRAFGMGESIAAPASVCAVAVAHGIDQAAAEAAMKDPAVKEAVREAVDAALSAGVFGSPFFIVDGEPFWGHDRMADLDQWLNDGGW